MTIQGSKKLLCSLNNCTNSYIVYFFLVRNTAIKTTSGVSLPTAVSPVKNLVKFVSLQRTRVAPRPDFRAYAITVVQYLNEITCVADYQGNSPWTDYALRSSSTLSQHQAEAQHLAPLRPSGGGADDGNSLIVIPGGVYAATGLNRH